MYGKLRKIFTLDFVKIYLMLLLFSGYYFFEFWSLEAVIIVGALLMLKHEKMRKTDRKSAIVLAVVLFNIVFTECITQLFNPTSGFSFVSFIYQLLSLLIAFFFTKTTDAAAFKESYINCMLAIAVVSLVGYAIWEIYPSIITAFPALANSRGRAGYFMVFSTVSDFLHTGANRNQGIFWEPGAYQLFLCLAYMFELGVSSRKPRKYVLALFLGSIITTFSTTGIVAGVLLLTLTLSRRKGNVSIVKGFGVVLLIAVALYLLLPTLTGFMKYTLVTKLNYVFNYQSGVATDASSRVDSIFYPLNSFLRSPIWGIGSAGYGQLAKEVGHSMFTCTPVNWIARFGIVFGAVVFSGLWKFFKQIFSNPLETAIVLGIFLLTISSEAVQMHPIIIALVFWGFSGNNKSLRQY